MRYLLTGHTGFKGAWLIMLLKKMGHEVSGLSLDPQENSIFATLGLHKELKHHRITDVRDFYGVMRDFTDVEPEVVIHLAAQPLVIEGYKDPLGTFETNVNGTLNVLEAARLTPSTRAVLVVTTDKVYKDTGGGFYDENAELGGYDPYSASKAMADILAQSFANLQLHYSLGIARAGNVIGMGDVSSDRLLPDINRALTSGEALIVRNLQAVRPWQHVLDCLSGYIKQVDWMLENRGHSGATIFNFGPDAEGYRTVGDVIRVAQMKVNGPEITETKTNFKETAFLTLNSEKAMRMLNWRNKIGFDQAVEWSILPDLANQTHDLYIRQIEEFSRA